MRTAITLGAAVLTASLAAVPAHAMKLSASQYGVIIASLPWAVALEKGMFKEAGLDIDGINSGAGGGTSVRNMLASEFPIGDVSTPGALAAIRAGVPLKIVGSLSNHIGDLAWTVKPDSGINSIKDLAGKKIAFTNPKSTTEMVVRFALEKENLEGKVEALSMGGLGPALTAFAQGAVASAPLNDPALTLQRDKYKVLFFASDYYPKFDWSVLVTTPQFAKEHPETVRKLLQVRRKAVDYMYANRDEAARIYAKVWNVSKADADAILPKYFDQWDGHWSRGDFSKEGLDAITKGMMLVGDIDKPVDWNSIIDQSFLDKDLRRPL